jgi:hypothetical protein
MLCIFSDSCPNIQAVYLTETCDKISGSFSPSRTHRSLFIYRPIFYNTEIILCLGYKIEPVNAVYGNNRCCSELITEHRNTQKLDTVTVKTSGMWSNHSRI